MSDTCPTVHLSMKRGDSLEFSFASYRTVNGVTSPYPMTGASIVMTAKHKISDADPGVFQITSTGGAIVVRAGLGETHIADVVVPPTATDAMTAGAVLEYDIQVTWSVTQKHTLQDGTLTVDLDVSRV